MFKHRSAAATDSPPSVELVRQRAKHRLIGVSVLVLAAVVLFPMLFDTQPRAIPVDIPIEIPSRKAAKPLTVEPTPVVTSEPAKSVANAQPTPVAPAEPIVKAKPEEEEVILSQTPARVPLPVAPVAPKAAVVASDGTKPQQAVGKEPGAEGPKDVHKDPVKPAPVKEPAKEAVKEAAKNPAKESTPLKEPVKTATVKDVQTDGARAQALLDGKAPATAAKSSSEAEASRFIVQVGAFADPAVAQSARMKLERAGLKTYTHEAQTPEGKRIRVRLGPFSTRAEAEKAAAKAKAAGTAAAILTL